MTDGAGACPLKNIDARGAAQRRNQGLLALFVAIGAAAAIVGFGVTGPWRAAVAVPLFFAGLGIFQARALT